MKSKLRIYTDFSVAKLTGFKIGGNVRYFVEVREKEEIFDVLDLVKRTKLPLFVLGEGTNILLDDKNLDAVFVQLRNKKIEFVDKGVNVEVHADSGAIWDGLVEKSVSAGLYGIECLSGIPGTVGAAPVQNVGAYGQELKNTFVTLEAFDLKKEKFVFLRKSDCEFGYRDSIFKKEKNKGRYIIWETILRLRKKGKPTLKYESLLKYLEQKQIRNPNLSDIRKAVLDLRSMKLENPDTNGNAGSFFKNPIVSVEIYKKLSENFPEIPFNKEADGKVKLFAGWLIDKAGWKGKLHKNAAVSSKNALVLLNRNNKATALEILELAGLIQKEVKQKFGIELIPEVQYVSF